MNIAEEILELIKPALNRQYINGSHQYRTSRGTTTIEGLLDLMQDIIDEHE